MNPKARTTLGTVFALLGGVIFTGLFYYLFESGFNMPPAVALGTAALIGGFQYFILRYIFLNVGGKKETDK